MKKKKRFLRLAAVCCLYFSLPAECGAGTETTQASVSSLVLADPDESYDISDFLGYYFYNTDENIFQEYEFANPEVMRLYINKNGVPERYTGLYYGTTGTSLFYTYDTYEIVSNTLICSYSVVNSYSGICEDMPGGKHIFKLGQNGELTEGEDVWYRSSKFDINLVWKNEQGLTSLDEIYYYALNSGGEEVWSGYEDRAYGVVDLNGDGRIEAVERGYHSEDHLYQFVIYTYDEAQKEVKRIGALESSSENAYFSPPYQRFVTYSRTSTNDNYFFYEIDGAALLDFEVYTYTDKVTRWFGYQKNGAEQTISEVPFGEWDDKTWNAYVTNLLEIQFEPLH